MTRPEGRDGVAALRARAEAIRDEQCSRVLSRLEECGEVTPRERAVVERLADRLVTRLLAPAEARLAAPDEGAAERRAAVLALFED